MRKTTKLFLVMLSLPLCMTPLAFAQTYTTIDYPGADMTGVGRWVRRM